ncbi:PTS sugar transporter subunit IIC [Macrococcus caseolyticus]|uniref:PTS sugar transporter subunit IIC n=1 Tax=Macrococcoides caseolyticum TaxID=69966 RepID=UPI0024BCDE5C|nr:PTS sugar transporter subunit IIC [Macrococcus caseolyticus]MDJ1155552.1 PTS sugar transporter subunit IIC [Macrococcus caseolyticus]MEB8171035.1 PTS sugar transporter subunit IIC [Macrococcus caseolyticus]
MDILIGTGFLLLVLVLFTLFTYKAPSGMKAMGALANAAIATFLVEAFQKYVGGNIFGIKFLEELGDTAGSLGGVAAAGLVALSIGVSPVYALVIAASCGGLDLLPGFVAGYVVGHLMKYAEKYVPEGVDLIVGIIIIAPLARMLAMFVTPLVNNTLIKIGEVIQQSTDASPLVMGFVLGGIITVVGTAPLSSMALTALLGLTGLPMAIAAMVSFSSAFINSTMFYKLKLGDRASIVAVGIEPLSQTDIISLNPVPIYSCNFIGGALAGMVIAHSGMVNDAPGTASPLAGFLVMFGFNEPLQIIGWGSVIAVICLIVGLVGSRIFKAYPLRRKSEFI